MDFEHVGKIIDKYQEKRTALISILHDIQDRYNFLPEEALKKVASRLRMDLNDIFGVATFYKSFSLVPKGKHSVTLCLGTACHVRGGPKILRELKTLLNIEPGQTTPDKQFSLNVVNCLGVCAIGPVMFVDGKFYGEMNPLKAKRVIEKINKNKRKSGVKS
ncbi:MAG: NAD(P)H-dependent oxidoreductase subunit E [Deltaproteobacteria bacterium]|nr:NAD(P)H-dependent oxidoreductase subunit E [Deltaproteobacteria bacterium]